MDSSFIPVNQPLLDGNEKKYLIDCIDSGWISSEGPYVSRFEEEFSSYIGRKFGVAVANGTAAIDIAIEALGISAGDEIIVPAFTIISCINQIVRNGAIPVLVDSDPDTWNMDVSQIRKKITDRTRAIMVVHIYGLPVDVEPILRLAKEFNLKIIEDAAEVHGQTYKGKLCGSFGDVSTFSFYPNKHITTGEGGMVLTDDKRIRDECVQLRNLCFEPAKRFVHQKLGWNARMTNLQAAVGVAQLEQIDRFIKIKRNTGNLYNKLLAGLPHVKLPKNFANGSQNIYWVYGLVLDQECEFNALSMMQMLSDLGVGTRPFFCPMHQQPILKNLGFFQNESHPVSEALYAKGFYIPSGMAIQPYQIEKVAEALWKILST